MDIKEKLIQLNYMPDTIRPYAFIKGNIEIQIYNGKIIHTIIKTLENDLIDTEIKDVYKNATTLYRDLRELRK